MAIGIVHLLRCSVCIRRGRAYRYEGSSAIYTCYCIRFESLILKMKVKVADDLDENWQAKTACQHAYVRKNWRFYI